MFRSRVTIPALLASAALLAGAGAASASVHSVPQPQVRAVTFVTDRPDGGNGSPDPYWADDTMTRTLVITRTGGTPGAYTYTATLTDEGEFITIKGAQAPNQAPSYAGEVIRSRSAGIIQGYADFSFTASTLPVAGAGAEGGERPRQRPGRQHLDVVRAGVPGRDGLRGPWHRELGLDVLCDHAARAPVLVR